MLVEPKTTEFGRRVDEMKVSGGRRQGFTLIELLVVIAIIAILAAILFPIFARARDKGRQTACLTNLKQIGAASKSYNSDYNGVYVPAAGYWPEYGTSQAASWTFHSWVYCFKPYIGEPGILICPSAPDPSIPANVQTNTNRRGKGEGDCAWLWDAAGYPSHYGLNVACAGGEPGKTTNNGWGMIPSDAIIPDTSRVIYISESKWADSGGDKGSYDWCIHDTFGRHAGGINVVCCDGHARFVQTKYFDALAAVYPNRPAGDCPVYWDYRKP